MSDWIWLTISIMYSLIVAATVVAVILRRKEPSSLAAWVLAIIFVPVLGLTLFAFFGSERITRRARHIERRKSAREGYAEFPEDFPGLAVADRPHISVTRFADVERLGQRLAHMPATSGNNVVLFNTNTEFYKCLLAALHAAKAHIHMEYYIWEADETGAEFRDAILNACQRGVECRLLMDSAGCWRFPNAWLRDLRAAGAKIDFFLKPDYTIRWPHINFRNHRKLTVVDGRVGFLGSANIGDEYLGRSKAFPVWIDSNLEMKGPTVRFLQEVFAEDWYFATEEDLRGDKYFPEVECAGNVDMQLLPSGPDQQFSPLEQVLFAIVPRARSSIQIVSPYFVPNKVMRMALEHAALRGVKVELLLSEKTDVGPIIWASRSYYPELLVAGVEIYEFELGMLHSKIVIVDGHSCLIGSANMDVRSFRLNFELGALLFEDEIAQRLSMWFEQRKNESNQVTLEIIKARSFKDRFFEGLARVLSPLL